VEKRVLDECISSNPRNPWEKWCVSPVSTMNLTHRK
jgi:hypothetical protein